MSPTPTPPQMKTTFGEGQKMSNGKEISPETIKVALEAVKMVYKFNAAWLQVHGREKEYTRAMDELEAAV